VGGRGWIGISQSVQGGVIERGLESGQISGCHRLPRCAAIAEVELETTSTKHGEITWRCRRGTVTLASHQRSWRIAREPGRFTATGSKSEE
jgi:hypothetical protein